ncbi:hypothetical protein CMO88_01525 [Candidatus Woesearchaeota archaeon]|jgi:pilus assembly protein TadC|nr:hypothetical protein [Candidatus Woesearchaeota archaeon]|tara:strand:+ start:1302 stop:1544 length:243 start_codon:yes stop_codon:yes gene_type:complete
MTSDVLLLGPLFAVFIFFIIVISLWELVWKGIALWKCGRNNQLVWFIAILIFNTAGILPIVYILFFQKKKKLIVKKQKKK